MLGKDQDLPVSTIFPPKREGIPAPSQLGPRRCYQFPTMSLLFPQCVALILHLRGGKELRYVVLAKISFFSYMVNLMPSEASMVM